MRRPRICVALLTFLIVFITSTNGVGDHKKSRVLSSFTFKPPFFPDAGLSAVPGWEPRGTSIVTADSIILTPNVAEKAGMLINKRPFFLKSVELTLEFKIHSDTQTPRGDGLALWLCDQTTRFGPTHGGPQTWNGVMVALDTYNDDNSGVNPSISVHLNDGTKTYDIENEGESTRVATCPSNFLDVETSSFLHLFIEDEKLSVFIDAKGTNDWVRCSSPISVSMPSRYFFSLTASTGSDRHEVHEVISLRINTMDPKLSIEDDMNRPEEREKAKSQLHEDDAPPPETVQEQDNHREPEVEEKKENEQINEKTEEDSQTEQQNQQKDDSRKTDPNISQEVQKMIDELEQQVNNLQTEKKNQEDYLKEAQRLLELKNNEEEHRNRDWEQKQRQLQEAQLLAQQLLREKEEEQNTGLAKYSNCNELKTECTNLRTIFQSLSDKTNSVSESFGHELVEIQYQFAQKLNDITTVLAPISSSSATIRTDTTQAKSQLSQLSRIISQLQTLLEQQVNRARDNSDKTQFSDTIENLTALQKTLVQMQVEQRKLDERQDTMREKLKRSQPSQLLEFVIALILGFQLLCQLVQKFLERKQRRRARGGVLF